MAIPHYITYGIGIGLLIVFFGYLFYAYIWKLFGMSRLFWTMFSKKNIAQVRDFLAQNPNFKNLSSEDKILLLSKSKVSQLNPLFISEIMKREFTGGKDNGNKKRGLFQRGSKEARGTAPESIPEPTCPTDLAGSNQQIEPLGDSKSGEDDVAPADSSGTKEKSRYFN